MKISLSSLFLTLSLTTCAYGMKSNWNLEALEQVVTKVECERQKADLDMKTVNSIIASCPDELKKLMRKFKNRGKVRKLPHYILLSGPAGVGKTTLGCAMAAMANAPYQLVDCPSIANEYKNSGTQNLIRIFGPILQQNREEVIILDEFTAITNKHSNQHDSDNDMATQLWQIMDKIKKKKQFKLLIFTSNINDKIPEPLKDRLSSKVFTIPLPDKAMRIKIAKHYLDKSGMSYDQSIIDLIARKTNHRSGRVIEEICENAISNAELRIAEYNSNDKIISKYRYDNFTNFNLDSIINKDVYEALADFNKSIKTLGYDQHSEFYNKIKKFGITVAPHLIPTANLILGICTYRTHLAQYAENVVLQKKGLAISEEGLKISAEGLKIAREGTTIAEKNLKIAEDAHNNQVRNAILNTVAATVTNLAINNVGTIIKAGTAAIQFTAAATGSSGRTPCTIL